MNSGVGEYGGPHRTCTYYAHNVKIFLKKSTSIKVPSFTYKTNDIIGCGLVYPPPKLNNKLPYIFFTQNGKQIGKAILIEEDSDAIRPYVLLNCCSIEANFGDSSFIYDVSKHYVTEEFYKEEEEEEGEEFK